jgi:hypothetical protein
MLGGAPKAHEVFSRNDAEQKLIRTILYQMGE